MDALSIVTVGVLVIASTLFGAIIAMAAMSMGQKSEKPQKTEKVG